MYLYLALLLIVIVAFLVFAKFLRPGAGRNAIGILGLCGSGKTQLFSQLCHQRNVLSVTSIAKSHSIYKVGEQNSLNVYDLPGHERIRYKEFNDVKQKLKAILFVIDASTIQKEIRDAAEFLYNIICDCMVSSGTSYLLVACNKQDLATAKGATLIQTSLEREMNVLRVTKANKLQSVGDEDNNNTFLGRQDEPFQFSHLSNLNVEFVETIATDGSDIDVIRKWMEKIGS